MAKYPRIGTIGWSHGGGLPGFPPGEGPARAGLGAGAVPASEARREVEWEEDQVVGREEAPTSTWRNEKPIAAAARWHGVRCFGNFER